MEYRPKAETQAKMVKWRDVDGRTIALWVEQTKCGESAGAAVFSARCRQARKHRRFAATTIKQRDRDRRYTFNSA
jgi:hypothetical protein